MTSSILTNGAAMSALQTLRSINTSMDTTQGRISSGYRVASAADNSAYWSIATTMRSDNAALSTVQDALGLGAAKTDTAYTGLDSAVKVVTEIKAKLVAAREPGVDKTKINKELEQLKNQLVSISQSATFSGENWLYNTSTSAPGSKEMVASFNRSANGAVAVTTLIFNAATSTLIDTNTANNGALTKGVNVQQPTTPGSTTTTTATYFLVNVNSTTSASGTQTANEIILTTSTASNDLDGMISAVDAMLQGLTDSASNLGAINSRIKMQDDFVSTLIDVISKGIGRLVDADMNEESTRLKALQTQQQLGIQALTIANSNSQNILALFKG
jgi:flagellin